MYRIGIDLGGTNIAVGLVSEDMKIVKKLSVPTGASREASLIIKDMGAACRRLIDEAGVSVDEITAVGIASPGIANHDEGVVEYANNLPFRKLPIASMLREYFPVENIRVENDANAAAWGEAVAGAAKGSKSSVMITLGTGVGGGIILDGKVQSGFNYAGGELGHIVICAGGRQCSCGRRGCWEAYSSATGLINMTKEKIEECRAAGVHTLMEDVAEKQGKISARTPYDAMRLGDVYAKEVVDKYVELLAVGLGNIVNIFQPEVVSLGGGVSNEKDNLLKPLIPLVRKETYGGGIVPSPEIRIAELGNDAGIIGAAFLGL